MRSYVTVLLVFLFAGATCRADVIHLKNGRTIWADRVRQSGNHLEYDVGDNSYAIPQALVDRIDSGGMPPQFASTAPSKDDVPDVVPEEELRIGADLPAKLIRDGKVDVDALRSVEDSSQPELTAAAYFIAGKHEFDSGNYPQALAYFDSALRFQHESPTVLNYYAAALIRMGRAKEAVSFAQHATRVAPDSADAFAVLGAALFAADRTREAVNAWKTSIKLRPDTAIQKYLEKAERDMKAQADFSELASNHFTLHFEGKETSESLRRQILMTLESGFESLSRDFNYIPRENIPVFLYTEQAFFDVTQAPSWIGAINDGKLRIPVSGVVSVDSELARILKHELAHSFINQMSGGRCPTWLHEGIAQVLEPKTLGDRGARLSQLFAQQHEIPFNGLERGFMQFSSLEAMLAYDESLGAVEYITDSYGTSELPQILSRIGQGSSAEMALRATIHDDYAQLRDDVAHFLLNKYGKN